MDTKIVRVNPALAAKFLKINRNMRNPNKTKINNMARDMKSGDWEDNGMVFRFHGNPFASKLKSNVDMFDGQNRCHAIIKSGTTQTAVCIYDIKTPGNYVDVGERRTLAQFLRNAGMSYSGAYAATVGNIIQYGNALTGTPIKTVTHADRIHTFEKYRRRLEQVVPPIFCKRKMVWRATVAAVLTLGTCPKEYPAAKTEFIEYLEHGEGMEPTDPVWLLRELMASAAKRQHRWETRKRLALVIKAWNYHREGELVERLAFRDTGPTAEDFPRIL